MQTLRWMRVPGDSIFALGELAMVWFVFALRRTKRIEPVGEPQPVMGD
jgi:nitric oxide reductase subunit B